MATYSYRCSTCNSLIDGEFPIGTALRERKCECGGTLRLRIGAGVNISATALETKGRPVRAVDQKEARWDRDMPAYKRMRDRGLWPDQIDGSAALEDRAGDQFDVKYDKLYDRLTGATDAGEYGITRKSVRERVREGEEQAAEIMDDAGATWKGTPVA